MTIHVESLKFQCVIGILDFERLKPQDVIVNLELNYDFGDEFINYADVAQLIKSSMIKKEFLLIEDALTDLSNSLKIEFSSITAIYLKITKPSILPDCRVSVSNTYEFNS